MNKLFIILILNIFCLFSYINIDAQSASTKRILYIVLVHSYSSNHVCTGPQRIGIFKAFKDLDKYFDVRIREYYMDAKVKAINETSQREVAEVINSEIIKIKPDYIFTTDDIAFNFVGIPMANRGFKIFSSGINKTLKEYQKETDINVNNIICIEERIRLDPLFAIFKQAMFIPHKYYILIDDTVTSYWMLQDYLKDLSGKGTVQVIKINTTLELNKFLINSQKEEISVIIIAIQKLFDFDRKVYIDKEKFFYNFKKFNHKHLELGGNIFFSHIGYSMCCGPDFEFMGETLGYKFLSIIHNKEPFQHLIITSDNFVSTNTRRIHELHLDIFLSRTFTVFDKTYNDYEEE